MAGIDSLTAAQLSQAAYIPKDTFAVPNGVPAGVVPTGWRADTLLSVARGDNQFIVFVNDDTRQVVTGFKGSNTVSQFTSDLRNDGAAQWAILKPDFESALANIRTKYAGYEVMTDGHSSGGGMSQTASLEYNLTGYGQNSLPIGQDTINNDPQLNNGQLAGAINSWRAAGNKFYEVNEDGDIATAYYSGKTFLYTNETTTKLSGFYAACMQKLLDFPDELGTGVAAGTMACAIDAHKIATVIQDLKSRAQGTLLNDPEAAQIINANADALAQKIIAASPIENLDGSIMFGADNTTVTVSPSSGIVQVIQNDVLKMQAQVLADAKALLKFYDTKNTHPYNELDVTKSADGKVTGAQIVLDQRVIDAGGAIGQIFGSALGNALGGKDQITRLVGGAAGGVIGGLIGQKFGLVVATSMAADLSKVSIADVFASQNINIADAGLGAVSSFLSAELGNALKIPGFGGQLFNAATNSFTLGVLTQVKDSITGGLTFDAAIAAIDWSAAVSGVIANTPAMAGNVIGTFLGQLLVPAKSHAGEIGGQLLGAIGSFLLPGVGSLIGTILGTVVGDLFGHTSHPAATDLLDQAGDHYAATHYQTSSSDGGAFSVPDQLADPALAIINGYLKAVNGAVLDHSKQVTIGYQTAPQSSYIVGVPSHPAAGVFFATGFAVQAAAVDVLQHLEVIGGDLLLKRGHHNSSFYNPPPMPPADPNGDPGPTGAPIQPIASTQLAILSADLGVAQDYENYLNNREAINALMAANARAVGSRNSCRQALFA